MLTLLVTNPKAQVNNIQPKPERLKYE